MANARGPLLQSRMSTIETRLSTLDNDLSRAEQSSTISSYHFGESGDINLAAPVSPDAIAKTEGKKYTQWVEVNSPQIV